MNCAKSPPLYSKSSSCVWLYKSVSLCGLPKQFAVNVVVLDAETVVVSLFESAGVFPPFSTVHPLNVYPVPGFAEMLTV